MKKAAIFAAALALAMSLTACGNRDNGGQTNGNQTNGTTQNGQNSGVNDDVNNSGGSSVGSGGSMTDPNGVTGNGTGTGTGTNSGTGTGTGTNSGTGTGTNSSADSRSRVGSDLRRAADGVGDAVTDLVDDGRNALSRATSATTFERMIDNARVHDADGVLTDGENSRW